jgi:hypothetical protein
VLHDKYPNSDVELWRKIAPLLNVNSYDTFSVKLISLVVISPSALFSCSIANLSFELKVWLSNTRTFSKQKFKLVTCRIFPDIFISFISPNKPNIHAEIGLIPEFVSTYSSSTSAIFLRLKTGYAFLSAFKSVIASKRSAAI